MKTLLLFMVMGMATVTTAMSAPLKPVGMLEGMVLNVYDGSNITLNSYGTQLYVHLYGIDAPVMSRISRTSGWLRKPGQPFARESFMALANKVLHKKVQIEILQITPHRQAPYQQALAIVWLDGRNINLEMVNEGWAWMAPDIHHGYARSFRQAQQYARVHKRGVWMQNDPLPPWEFRKRSGEKSGQ